VKAIECQGVTFSYRSGQGLAGVSFAVDRGEILGIVGPNSAGKSTLLRLLSKVVLPQQGRIRIEGCDVTGLSRLELARRMAVIPQTFEVAFPFRVAEIVWMGRYPHGAARSRTNARDQAAVQAALEATGLAALAARRMDELSGGERQLVSIAKALAQEPSVLLLDEPTAHLDLRHQRVVVEVLFRLRRERQGTSILVSHDLNLAAEYCDRLLLLGQGRVLSLGPPEEVITPEYLEPAYGCPVTVDRHPVSGRPRVQGNLEAPHRTGTQHTTHRM
jgi:iron complex transport system ATP-binding protein